MIGLAATSQIARPYAVDFASLRRERGGTVDAEPRANPASARPAARVEDGQKVGDGQKAGARANPNKLTPEEERIVARLRQREAEVKAHESAHKMAGGPYAGAPSYTYTTGPDGRQYITGGEVQVDMSPVQGDAEATVRKMEQLKRAALAPSDPSSADRAAAAQAEAIKLQAQSQVKEERQAKQEENGTVQPAASSEEGDSANSNESPSEGSQATRSRAAKAYNQIAQIINTAAAAGLIA